MKTSRWTLIIFLMCCYALNVLFTIYLLQMINFDWYRKMSVRFLPWFEYDIQCYSYEAKNILEEISACTSPPAKGSSIFFHETSCASSVNGSVVMSARQACAVESAANMNPEVEVYLLMASPIRNSNESSWDVVVRQLLSYSNVRIHHVNLDRYVLGTPLEEWYLGGPLQGSRWPRMHASDVLRFLTLWKYGGTYLDLDVVVTRTLGKMSNFAGAESKLQVAAGVLNFAADGAGHVMAEKCLGELRETFQGGSWFNNGPGVITRVLRKTCGIDLTDRMTAKRCQGFTVHPPKDFYPIHYTNWKLYFEEKNQLETMSKIKDSYTIHLWNKLSLSEPITVGSKQPYGIVAKKYCPKVYSSCGDVF